MGGKEKVEDKKCYNDLPFAFAQYIKKVSTFIEPSELALQTNGQTNFFSHKKTVDINSEVK